MLHHLVDVVVGDVLSKRNQINVMDACAVKLVERKNFQQYLRRVSIVREARYQLGQGILAQFGKGVVIEGIAFLLDEIDGGCGKHGCNIAFLKGLG